MATVLDQTPDTNPSSDDAIYVINDPAGTPADRYATLGNAIKKAHGLSNGVVKISSGTMAIATAGTDYLTTVDWGDIGGTLSDQTDLQTALSAKADDSAVVHDTGTETIAGAKTFSSAVVVPDDAYDATGWNGSAEVPTKNAIRDKLEAMGAGGAAAWGAITGTLSDQTDLQTALDGKVDENSAITGATKTKITYDAKGLVTAGANATQDDIGDGTTYKQYSQTEKTKLAGIATGATANDTDANLKNRANHTGTQTASTISDFDTQVRTSTLNQMTAPTADLSINSHKLTNVTDPSSNQDAATKAYVDALALNLGKRARARAATTANITIATALNNGDSLDGVTLATGDIVLVKDQTAPAENGIYVVSASPARSTEYDTWAEHPGSQISVAEGSTNADTLWLCTSNEGGTLGTNSIVFSKLVVAGELLASNNLSDLSNAATSRTNLGVAIGTNVQAWDADLDTWATKTAPSGTVVGTSDSQTLTTKTIALGSNTVSGSVAEFNTALTGADFYTSGGTDVAITDGGTGVSTLPSGILIGAGTSAITAVTAPSGTVVGTTDSQTLTNKTLTSPVISTISNTGTLTLPTSTDTLVGRATTDTLTNKTLTSPAITTPTGIVKGDVGLGNVDNTSNATERAATRTLTNARITPRVGTTASSSTPTPDGDSHDHYTVTALAANATFGAPTGTPTDGQKLLIRIKDNGTARTLSWNAIYIASGMAALLSTTVISKTHLLGFIYDSAATKWVCVSSDSAGY